MVEKLVICQIKDECDAVVCIHKVPHVKRDSCRLGSKVDRNDCNHHYMSCGEVEDPAPFVPSRVLSVNGYTEIIRACWECPMQFTDFEPYKVYCALNNLKEFHAAAHEKGFDDIIVIENTNDPYSPVRRPSPKEPFHVTCPLPEEPNK